MKRILTIAGSDSGGGAGIQADLKAITVLGGYGLSVLTALTAQNTVGVQGVFDVPAGFIRLQLDSVLSDISADAAKTGMLSRAEAVRAVAEKLAEYKVPSLVVDPVMVAKSGDRLLADEAVEALKIELLPLATMVTPNLPEASVLWGKEVKDLDGMKAAAEAIAKLGPKTVLVKGGHLEGRAVDLFFDGERFETFASDRIETRNTHGTGCTLSAALATFLSQGYSPKEAVRRAKDFITRAIRGGLNIGAGHGPTNPYAHVQAAMERAPVLEELRAALQRLLREPLGRLIPEIRSNLGFALPYAAGPDEVAAVPGRITNVGDRLLALGEPTFGASRHIAKVILAANRRYAYLRSAMNIRHGPEIVEACRRAGLKVASFDRSDEPREIKEKEGSTLEWGTGKAIDDFGAAPDAIYDLGEVGKEPVIRILGRRPGEVVEKVIAVGREL